MNVIVLVGECGCEVCEFIEYSLLLEVCVWLIVVVLMFDCFVMECVKFVLVVIVIVEYFCDVGKCVLLLVDLLMCFVCV